MEMLKGHLLLLLVGICVGSTYRNYVPYSSYSADENFSLIKGYVCNFEVAGAYVSSTAENVVTKLGVKSTELECATSCVAEKLKNKAINGISYANDASKLCWCLHGLTKLVKRDTKWKTCFLKKRNYEFIFSTGEGYGDNKVQLDVVGTKATKEECIEACLTAKNADPKMNAVVYSTDGTKKCSCQRGMTAINTKVTTKKTSKFIKRQYDCTTEVGSGMGNYEYAGLKATQMKCLSACVQKMATDKKINSMSYSNDGNKACFCGKEVKKIVKTITTLDTCILEYIANN